MIRIATRESPLALWQADHVKQLLKSAHPGLDVVIHGMTTEGDRNKTSPLSKIGGKGVFVKELEHALLSETADIAVHSMKDVPAVLPEGLEIAAICAREDPRDAFVSNAYSSLADMPPGASVGTSSLRRRIQIQARFPRLIYPELRGNVDTRLRKLGEGDYDAIILAAAGLVRLGLKDRIVERIAPEFCLPAAGQGAVGIECRGWDERVKALLRAIDHEETSLCVRAERMVSSGLGASCNLPIAAFAQLHEGGFRMSAFISDLQGKIRLQVLREGAREQSAQIAAEVTRELISQGAGELIAGN